MTWNLPNVLTLARLVCVPIVAVLLFIDDPLARDAAAVVFLAAAITDFADGAIARRRGTTSDFGAIADPIADKALITVALLGLSILGDLAWWVTVVILIREFGITVLRMVMLRYGVIAASKGGKLKTVVQIIAITMLLAVGPQWWNDAGMAVMYVAVALTVLTGVDYLLRAAQLRRAEVAQ